MRNQIVTHCCVCLFMAIMFSLITTTSLNCVVFNVNIEPANSIQAVVDTLTSNSNYTYNLYLRHYGNVVIHSENLILGGLECDVNFYAGSDSVITESDLNKIIIDGMGVSSTIFMNNCNNNMTFNGMTIRNGAGYYTMGSTYGGGIYIGPFHSSPTSIHINKCTIKDNHANRGAGICVESGTQVESLLELYINDSCIKNNGPSGSTISTTGGGIRIDSGNLYINNSSFLENYSGNGGGIYKSGVTSISEVTISNSIIHHNSAAYSASAIHFEGALNVVRRSELKLLNTTIANNECDTAYDGWNGVTVLCVRDVSHQNDLEMINSILWNNTSDSIVEPQIIIQGGSSYGTNTVNYNCVQLGCPAGSNNLTDNTDPLLVDEDNYDYNLKWTSSEKSPCIMAGYDQFGSDHYDRTDMGAIQYEANPHEYYTYRFPPHSERHGIKWMSFPTADRILSSPDQDMAFTMFDPIMQIPPPVTGIQWKPNNSYIQNLYYYNNQWYGNNHSVIPEQGYKFTSDENLSTPVHLYIKGLVYPDDTATSIVALLNGLPNENWVGYYLDKTLEPMDAFQGCINNLYYIQTQDWTMSRVKPSPNSNWIIPAGDLSISYGDMVIVKCFSNGEIVWNAPAPDKEKTEKLLPQYYAYEEKTEYVPIYVDINSSAKDMPDEVGVFIDDECKGAAVVLGDLVEVPAYILDDLDENPEIEVRLHYDSKMSDIIPVYQTWNHDSEAYEEHSLIISKKRDYYRISIGDENGNIGEIPNPKFFISNYPNPFIPDTNIKYYTPVDSEISLDIFNVKGQKVISLVTGYQDKGFHQVNWDGKDNKGHTLSSGVYFAIMKYKGGQISHKMILMK